ncbi:hypothetical protein [Tumebacillus lipolyticus]|uniref:Lipoprotein n=1 Tax=Tumebacillus lipolyticus TaxID=1280370 RepID=A0ABW5A1V0_9BACL
MKKALSSLLVAALCVTALTGCGDKQAENNGSTDKPKTEVPKLNEGEKNPQGQDQNEAENGEDKVPESTDESHLEIKEAFGLSGYRAISTRHLTGIALGKLELPIDDQLRLTLAKAISLGISGIEWQPEDAPPGIFLSTDATEFAIGTKRKNGELVLDRYKLEGQDWKKTGRETKPGK